jgi:hypothetical protein
MFEYPCRNPITPSFCVCCLLLSSACHNYRRTPPKNNAPTSINSQLCLRIAHLSLWALQGFTWQHCQYSLHSRFTVRCILSGQSDCSNYKLDPPLARITLHRVPTYGTGHAESGVGAARRRRRVRHEEANVSRLFRMLITPARLLSVKADRFSGKKVVANYSCKILGGIWFFY